MAGKSPWTMGLANTNDFFKKINKSLIKLKKDILGVEIKSLGTPEPLPTPSVPYFNGHTVMKSVLDDFLCIQILGSFSRSLECQNGQIP